MGREYCFIEAETEESGEGRGCHGRGGLWMPVRKPDNPGKRENAPNGMVDGQVAQSLLEYSLGGFETLVGTHRTRVKKEMGNG